jgi:hypothetical protein
MGDIPPRPWGVSTRRRRLCRCETRHHGRDLKGWRSKCWDVNVKTWFGPCLFGPCRPRFSKIGPWTSGFGAEFWSPSSRKTMGVWKVHLECRPPCKPQFLHDLLVPRDWLLVQTHWFYMILSVYHGVPASFFHSWPTQFHSWCAIRDLGLGLVGLVV